MKLQISVKKTVIFASIAVMILVVSFMMRFIMKWPIIVSSLILVIGPFYFEIKNKYKNLYFIFTFMFYAMSMFIFCQDINEVISGWSLHSMGYKNLINGVFLVFTLYMIIYLFTQSVKISVNIGSLVLIFLATVDLYVFRFRGSEFSPADILSAKTALNVLPNYSLIPFPPSFPTPAIRIIFVMLLLYCFNIEGYEGEKHKNFFVSRLPSLVLSFGLCLYLAFVIKDFQPYNWSKDGAVYGGYYLNFIAEIKNVLIPKPQDYNVETLEEIYEKTTGSKLLKNNTGASKRPNVVVVMNESFANLNHLSENLETNEEVMPYINSLNENTVKGYALSSVFGGTTANSEFEFLTGFTMAFLPVGSVPYEQYIKTKKYSLVSYFSDMGYNCIAAHPYYSSGWNRKEVYNNLGFDEMHFIEDFPNDDYVRGYISDDEMYGFIEDSIEKNEKPIFLFGVTMQNHGGYDYDGCDFEQSVKAEGLSRDYKELNQYLELVQRSDEAVGKMIEYFKTIDEDTIIVFFGDHLPKVEDEAYNELKSGNKAENTMALMYEVPFFIWANYDIEEDYIECTSLNYLGSLTLKYSGIDLPNWNRYLYSIYEEYPAINRYIYKKRRDDFFMDVSNINEENDLLLSQYSILQYNGLFDRKNINKMIFSVEE